MLSDFFLRYGTTKNLISKTEAPGKVLIFINLFCDIFDSLRADNIESPTMRMVHLVQAGTVLLLRSNKISPLRLTSS